MKAGYRPSRRTVRTCNGAFHCGDSTQQEHLLSALGQAVQQSSKQELRVEHWTEPAAYQFGKLAHHSPM